jgi:hypothetical protein
VGVAGCFCHLPLRWSHLEPKWAVDQVLCDISFAACLLGLGIHAVKVSIIRVRPAAVRFTTRWSTSLADVA